MAELRTNKPGLGNLMSYQQEENKKSREPTTALQGGKTMPSRASKRTINMSKIEERMTLGRWHVLLPVMGSFVWDTGCQLEMLVVVQKFYSWKAPLADYVDKVLVKSLSLRTCSGCNQLQSSNGLY